MVAVRPSFVPEALILFPPVTPLNSAPVNLNVIWFSVWCMSILSGSNSFALRDYRSDTIHLTDLPRIRPDTHNTRSRSDFAI